MSDATDHRPDDDLLAAEYVLGLLSPSEMRAAEQRLEREQGFAVLVRAWQQRLIPWADEIAPVTPSDDVWQRIEATLPTRPMRRMSDQVRPMPLWNGLAFWRGLALGTGGLALASIAALLIMLAKPVPAPLVAALESGGQRTVLVTLDAQRGTMLIVPTALSIPQGRVPELWLIAPGDKPRSLGLINSEHPVTIAVPSVLLAQATAPAVLAVSDEPPGGSPTGAPTGHVIAQGRLTSL